MSYMLICTRLWKDNFEIFILKMNNGLCMFIFIQYLSIACLVCLSPFTWSKIITNNRNMLLFISICIYMYVNILNIHVTNTSCKHHCTLRYTCPWKSRHGAGPPRVRWTSLLSLSLLLVVVFKSLSFFLQLLLNGDMVLVRWL